MFKCFKAETFLAPKLTSSVFFLYDIPCVISVNWRNLDLNQEKYLVCFLWKCEKLALYI